MLKLKFSCLMMLVGLNTALHAQYSHQFTNTARNTHYGSAFSVAVGSDGTVFLANYDNGLRAYT
ncbi:MAG TPA: hypothetical protein PKN24_15160, partial [bacterium]|nr:hypothetical protein [bacterium]